MTAENPGRLPGGFVGCRRCGVLPFLATVGTCVLTACALESEVESAHVMLETSARVEPDEAVGGVSAEQLARLLAPDPPPPTGGPTSV